MNSETKRLEYLDRLRNQTKQLNKEEKRRGVLLYFPGIEPDDAIEPRISAERHARIPQFQYFLNYIRGIRGYYDPNDKHRRKF